MKELTQQVVDWTKQTFDKLGVTDMVLGISGGKDSSVVAALLVEALGKENVVGVLMPNGEQFDIDVSKDLVEFLGIKSVTINIKDAYNGFLNEYYLE